ncbi:MAG TPA: MucR family transcriptional regulator [Stellaceae bacterium]|nr:MucR family transcriptional regulator [Stellaceae bacterium]
MLAAALPHSRYGSTRAKLAQTGEASYRARWGLGNDFPMVAKNYAARRSALAKSFGFGLRGGRRRAVK